MSGEVAEQFILLEVTNKTIVLLQLIYQQPNPGIKYQYHLPVVTSDTSLAGSKEPSVKKTGKQVECAKSLYIR